MHLKIDINIVTFLADIRKCQNDVYYETVDGDILNLTSALSQFVFCSIVNHPHFLKTGIVRCDNVDDYIILKEYLNQDE